MCTFDILARLHGYQTDRSALEFGGKCAVWGLRCGFTGCDEVSESGLITENVLDGFYRLTPWITALLRELTVAQLV